jgi:hypothetical protein
MPNELICQAETCLKAINGKGVIHEGKPYHHECLYGVKSGLEDVFYDALNNKFGVDIDDDIWYDLAEEYDFKPEEVLKYIDGHPWSVIAEVGDGRRVLAGFRTKKHMLTWIEEHMWEVMVEGGTFWVNVVFKRGKIVSSDIWGDTLGIRPTIKVQDVLK